MHVIQYAFPCMYSFFYTGHNILVCLLPQGKDTTESRLRGANNSTGRGGKSGADRYLGRGGSTPYYSGIPSMSSEFLQE